MSPNRTGVREYATKRVRLCFSFRIDTGNNPDAIRQELCKYVTSVTRTAAGRYTVKFENSLLPRQLTFATVTQHNPDEAPVAATCPAGGYVKNLAIDVANRQIEVNTLIENAGAASVVGEPEDNTWVSVLIEGPETDTRKDAA